MATEDDDDTQSFRKQAQHLDSDSDENDVSFGESSEKFEEFVSGLSEMNQLKDDVASQMINITNQVSLLQEELMVLKNDNLSGMLEALEISETTSYSVDGETTQYREETSENATMEHIGNDSTSPVLKRSSSYHINGKLAPTGLKRRISWSPNVIDNAKGPGEDSLSDIIKKRSLNRRNRANPTSAFNTILYCIIVYLVSMWAPTLIEYVLGRRGD